MNRISTEDDYKYYVRFSLAQQFEQIYKFNISNKIQWFLTIRLISTTVTKGSIWLN